MIGEPAGQVYRRPLDVRICRRSSLGPLMAVTLGVRSPLVAAYWTAGSRLVMSSATAKSFWRELYASSTSMHEKAAVGIDVEIDHPAYVDGVARVHRRASGSRPLEVDVGRCW
jgi:hypothetical protein